MLDQFTNYRPVSILPLLSIVHQRVICDQVPNCFNEIFCGFRRAHGTQHTSFESITSWQTSLGRGGFVGSILMDLLKAYDFLKGFLLLAKLQAYGFNKKVQDYFSVI